MKLTTTTTTEVTTQVKLSTKTQQMVMERLRERTDISAKVAELEGTKTKPGRKRRVDDEIVELFRKEKQGKALLDGVDINGYSLALVIGKTKKFDQLGFMKAHGITQEDFDAFTSYDENDPYLKVTAPKGVK